MGVVGIISVVLVKYSASCAYLKNTLNLHRCARSLIHRVLKITGQLNYF